MPSPARNSTQRCRPAKAMKPQKTPRWARPTSGRSRDGPRLEDDLGDEPQEAAARSRRRAMRMLLRARRIRRARVAHLRREGRDEPEDEDAEDPGLGGVH